MLGLVALMGLPVIEATGQTKALNFASNVVSLAILALHGHIIWIVGLAMIPAQVAGASLGARLAMRRGTALIKPLIVVVCLAMALRLAADYV
jgi:uncharacterized membrane protein YfcA